MAVNREDMCSVIYNDIHKPMYGWIPYSVSTGELGEYRDQAGEPLKEIKDDLKELLLKGMQELGLGSDPSTLDITYTLSGTTEWTRNYAAYCQQMWEKTLGVKVELDFNEWGTFQSKTNNGEYQMGMMTLWQCWKSLQADLTWFLYSGRMSSMTASLHRQEKKWMKRQELTFTNRLKISFLHRIV